ncbi:MAG: type I 3-dehydroquinate dehydratase, partial [Thermodesulfobacteriota bacterium]|nr:type I 3-dehydroquinate dehydratase [Thermodesulfobacteriota bacterium]
MFCIPIIAKNTDEALKKIGIANAMADILEIRLDVMDIFDLQAIIQSVSKPVIVTYRSKKQGGNGTADYETRIRYLLQAIEMEADFVDVEYSMPLDFRQKLFHVRSSSRLIISNHLSGGTPSSAELENIFRKMAATGADIVKIITHARRAEDNLRILGLIPFAHNLSVKIIAFAMGRIGRISRIATLLMGGYMTFASLEEGQESALGQIPVS